MNILLIKRISDAVAAAESKHPRGPISRHEFWGVLHEEVDELWHEIKSDAHDEEIDAEVLDTIAVLVRWLKRNDA